MSESLAWEKWSTFSHNRYVEEAEKFSRPGSVAEKKAYFEAHYRKKAAERAAALIREANDSSNRIFDSETQDGTCNNSSIEIKSKADSNVTVVEQPDSDAVNYVVADNAGRNKYKSDVEQSEVDISRVERSEYVPETRVDTNPSVENSSLVDNFNQFDSVEVNKKIAMAKDRRMPDPGTAGQEIQAMSVGRREVNSSLKLPSKTGAAERSYSLAERKAAVQANDKINSALRSKKSVRDSVEKRRTAPSLHMSINLPSCAGLTSKTTSVSEQNRIRKINPNLPKIHKDALDEASSNPQSEGRRTLRLLTKSLSRGVTSNAKLSSLSVDCLKSSSTTRINPRLPTMSSPFKFRSEERVAKRKEFFQRVNEIKSQEAEKVQLQKRCKEKTEHDHKKLQQNSGSKSKLNEDLNGGLRSPSNQMRKVPVTRPRPRPRPPSNQMKKVPVTPPRSPNLGRKASSNADQDKSSRNSWKPPNPITTKRITEKINQTTKSLVTSLVVRKITLENASPNIQR